jgi:hypothetical protein
MTAPSFPSIAHPHNSKGSTNMFDLGYLGVEDDFLEQKSSLPYKKKRNILSSE